VKSVSTSLRSVFALFLGLVVVASGCSKSGGKPDGGTGGAVAGSIAALTSGATEVGLFPGLGELTVGESVRLSFGLVTEKGDLLVGGNPAVYLAKSPLEKAVGPFRARFERYTAYAELNDHSPIGAPGFFVADVRVPSPGRWDMAVVATQGDARAAGSLRPSEYLPARDTLSVAAVGSKAIPVATPVATSLRRLKEVCTRTPPDPMHYISLDRALTNGKPTVVSFATPALCESRMCGPVVDEQLKVFTEVGPQKANFVHVEEFPPGPELMPDQTEPAQAFLDWGFRSEPWVVVVDSKGIIRASFEGPVVASEIRSALEPLLE
jgi:hypothetical protein